MEQVSHRQVDTLLARYAESHRNPANAQARSTDWGCTSHASANTANAPALSPRRTSARPRSSHASTGVSCIRPILVHGDRGPPRMLP